MKTGDLYYVQWQRVGFLYVPEENNVTKWNIVAALHHGSGVIILDPKRVRSVLTNDLYYVWCLTCDGTGYVRESALTQELRERMFPDS